MYSRMIENNKLYKAKIFEVYSNNIYKIELKLNNYIYYYYNYYLCKISNNNEYDLTKINTILNQFQQNLYVKVIAINKMLTVEIKVREEDQYINLF